MNLQSMSGLYIHIPFCHSKCIYCDFFSTPKKYSAEAYIDALLRELRQRSHEIEMPPATVYIGGGTPSIVPQVELQRLIDGIPAEKAAEFTIEVNPEDVDDSFARFLARSPVNRVSMGVQSMVNAELRAIGRRHSAADSLNACHRLRDAGIENISLDLMFGLPGQTVDSWRHSLETVLGLAPEHLSAYSLMYEPGTRLWAMRENGKIKETPQEVSEEMYSILCRRASENGYSHYEISNFAIPGKESRHNSSYWDLTPYLGLGTSAHSFDGNTRRYNPDNISDYISSATPLFIEERPETQEERIDEYIMIRLRTARGLDMNKFRNIFGTDAARTLLDKAVAESRKGLVTFEGDRFFIPERHWLVADTVIVALMCDRDA